MFNYSFGQGEHNIWYFGDKAGIDFNTSPPIPLTDGKVSSIENSATISDSDGNLLFYSGGDSTTYNHIKVWDRNHNLMQNGDSIIGNPSETQGLLILPFDNFGDKYYLFSIGYRSLTPFGRSISTLNYSVIDLNKNGGLGEVTQKNTLIYADFATLDTMLSEKMTAVKHANGRDYWLITHLIGVPYVPYSYTPTWYGDCDVYVKYLITPFGIKGPFYQRIGSIYSRNSAYGQMKFNEQGNQLAIVSFYVYLTTGYPRYGIIDLFDFDRCSGLLSNYQYLGDDPLINSKNFVYGCSFSPSGNLLYVTNQYNDSRPYLLQFDLNATNISASKTTIWTDNAPWKFLGQMQCASDNKIYISAAWGDFNGIDSLFSSLGVINNPDVVGVGCNFSPTGFDLGGRRTYVGLPNTPTDNLGKIEGSPCDTIVNETSFNLFPNPSNGTFSFTYYFDVNSPEMFIYNSLGQFVTKYKFEESGFGNGNITLDVSSGIYYYRIIADGNVLFRSKFIVVK